MRCRGFGGRSPHWFDSLNDRAQLPGDLQSRIPGSSKYNQLIIFILAEPSVRSMAFRTPSLLPTTTQRLIELDQGREFVSLRLGQPQFSRKRVGIVRQNFKVVSGADFEAHF